MGLWPFQATSHVWCTGGRRWVANRSLNVEVFTECVVAAAECVE